MYLYTSMFLFMSKGLPIYITVNSMDGTTRRHMCVVYDLQVHRTFSFLKNEEVLQTMGLYTYYFH